MEDNDDIQSKENNTTETRGSRRKKRKRAQRSNENDEYNELEHSIQIEILPLIFPYSDQQSNEGNEIKKTKKRIRVVRPYPFTFNTFAKARWIGREILDVYNDEFGSYPKCYYEAAILEGRILVSGKQVPCSYRIKGGDKLSHTVHRHEPAVLICDDDFLSSSMNNEKPNTQNSHQTLIKIIHQDESIIVVDKPPTLPIHPCGGYNFNSLFHILSTQIPSLKNSLFNVHRLDRLTSGLTIVAKNTNVAQSLGRCITDRENCFKVYLARVKGRFPLNAPLNQRYEQKQKQHSSLQHCDGIDEVSDKKFEHDDDVQSDGMTYFWISNQNGHIQKESSLDDVFGSRMNISSLKDDGTTDEDVLWLTLACPCEVICHKNGICKAGNGKHAQTSFTVLGYDEETDSTVVLAKPMTGRTHQIRLHLQYLNHPIGNDPNYGGIMFYGNPSDYDLCQKAKEKMKQMDHDSAIIRPTDAISTDVPATEAEIINSTILQHQRMENETLDKYIERTCVWCARCIGGDRTVLEFLVRSQGIWLHAYQYCLLGPEGKICYKTDIPDFALIICRN